MTQTRWIESGVPVGKVKALLEGVSVTAHDGGAMEDRTRIWLEAWRLSRRGWKTDMLTELLDLS